MARITTSDVSNFDESKELAAITQQGRPVHWPPVHRVSVTEPDSRGPAEPLRKEAAEDDEAADDNEESDPSAGTNSSTSGSRPEPSGSPLLETQASLQSPAPDAGSPSAADQPVKPQPSTASSTSGSGQGTGSGQALQSGSSAVSAAPSPATRVSAASEEDPGSGGFAVSGSVE